MTTGGQMSCRSGETVTFSRFGTGNSKRFQLECSFTNDTQYFYPPCYDVLAKYASCTRSRRSKVGQTETAPAIKLPPLFTLPAIHLSRGVNVCQTETYEFVLTQPTPEVAAPRADVGRLVLHRNGLFSVSIEAVTFRWQRIVDMRPN